MKSILTLLTVLFPIASLFAQTQCKVTISYEINKTNPPSYTFRTNPKIEGANYYWYFGNDGKSDSPVPNYTFTSSGEFLVQVKVVKGNDVCYGELKTKFEGKSVTTNVVTLSGKGKVKKTGADGCGLLITMDNGKVLVPAAESIPFEYKDGQYVELVYQLLDKASGCTSGLAAKITKIAVINTTVPTECNVKIVVAKSSSEPGTYTFTTNPQAAGSIFYWSFGDNTSISNEPSPKHTFNLKGSYAIYVKVKGTDGKYCTSELKSEFEGKSATPAVVTLSGKGKVKKTGTDACGVMITLDGGKVLVPVSESVQFAYTDGQYVELIYQLLDRATGCNAGVAAKISKITAINTTTPTACIVKINSSKSSSSPIKYTFTVEPKTDGAKYYWSFGDNTNSDSPAPMHAFSKAGLYSVLVKITGADGKICTGELKAEFAATTTTTPTPVTLTGKGKVKKTGTDACGVMITIDGGKVLVPVAESIQFAYTDGQYVEVVYQLLDKASGCNAGVAAKITKITAINTTAPTVCNVKIILTKNSTTPVGYTFKTDPYTPDSKYVWMFSDNSSSELPSPTHVFSKGGTYSVVVKVTGKDGKVCTSEMKAEFVGTTPEVVTLYTKGKVTKTGTGACGINITVDGGKILIPAAESVTFDYKVDQYYELAYQLSAIPSPCSSGLSVKIIKISPINTTVITPSNCNVKIISTKNTEPGSYSFKLDGATTYAKYYWKFSDNTISDAASPKHTFSKGGSYKVYVQVTGADGKTCVGELTAQFDGIPVAELPNCPGTFNMILLDPTNNSCNGSATVKLLDVNGKDIPNVYYLWNDGRNGSSAKELCPGKLYTVKATVEGTCKKTTSFTLIAKPVWQSSTLNGQNNFTVVAPLEGVQYEWDFGNGVTKTGTSVSYNFSQDGVYDVTLKAVSTSGSSESLKQIIVANKMANTAMIDQIEIGIYPNPAKEILRVDLKNPADGTMTIEIKDISGHSVYLEKLNNDGSSHSDINIQNLKAGIYVLRVVGDQGIIGERKFIKSN